MSPKLGLSTWYSFDEGDERNKVRYVAKVLTAATSQMQIFERRNLIEDLKRKLSHYL